MLEKPLGIYIQPINKCNARCTICPQQEAMKKFGEEKMKDEVYYSIIDQLGKDYIGVIAPYLMCEPLLDNRIYDFIKYAKDKCPGASVEISTNGSLLTEQRAERLASVNPTRVHINIGGATKKTYEKRMGLEFEKTISNINYFRKIYRSIFINFVLYKDNEKEKELVKKLFPKIPVCNEFYASNRGGNLKVKHKHRTRFTNCNLQFTDMYIVSNGNVIQCCNDYMRTSIYGNVRTEKLFDLWNKKPISYDLKICQKCL